MATRLLIYAHAFAPMIGGAESAVMSLAMGVAKSQAGSSNPRVTVATATPRGEFDDASLPFDVVRQPRTSQLMKLIRSSDVIHLAGPCFIPLLMGLSLRKPVVVEHHGFQAICPNGQLLLEPSGTQCPGHFMAGRHAQCLRCNAKNGMVRSLALWFFTFSRRWLCMHATANIMPTNWLGGLLQLPRSTTVYHGLTNIQVSNRAWNSAPHSALNSTLNALTPASSTFAFVGRLVSTKGVQVLLQAAQQVRAEGLQFLIKIIGDGPDRQSMESRVIALGLSENVIFLGYVSDDDLERHLADVSTIVMPSLAGEVFGLVAAENMARGKLLIASDSGALSEVIGDAGLTFPAGNATGLARCMKQVLQDQTFAAKLRAAAQIRAANEFDEGQMLERHLQIYSEVAACAN
jgi:glycosyltransferase involved in cell wall biosynthesis